VRPTNNAEQGTHVVELRTTLTKYQTVIVPNSVFEVTVVPNINSLPHFDKDLGLY